MRIHIHILVWSVVFLGATYTDAQYLLPFQGVLANPDGKAVSDGEYLIQFQIYEAPTGGTALWGGELHRTSVNGGLVNVVLGTENAFPLSSSTSEKQSFFDQVIYLQITIDANQDGKITVEDPPLLPRSSIIPVVYAKEAGNARTLNGFEWSSLFIDGKDPTSSSLSGQRLADLSISGEKIEDGAISQDKLAVEIELNLVPSGAIVAWSGPISNIPTGWCLCDGTNGTPDLRNRFIIGADQDVDGEAKSNVGGEWTRSGGSATKNLTHTHKIPFDGWGNNYHDARVNGRLLTTDVDGWQIFASSEQDSGSGGSAVQDVMNPYYSLAFIMKL
jgi:hypothetical protein